MNQNVWQSYTIRSWVVNSFPRKINTENIFKYTVFKCPYT